MVKTTNQKEERPRRRSEKRAKRKKRRKKKGKKKEKIRKRVKRKKKRKAKIGTKTKKMTEHTKNRYVRAAATSHWTIPNMACRPQGGHPPTSSRRTSGISAKSPVVSKLRSSQNVFLPLPDRAKTKKLQRQLNAPDSPLQALAEPLFLEVSNYNASAGAGTYLRLVCPPPQLPTFIPLH